jgi:hypothetical protein
MKLIRKLISNYQENQRFKRVLERDILSTLN